MSESAPAGGAAPAAPASSAPSSTPAVSKAPSVAPTTSSGNSTTSSGGNNTSAPQGASSLPADAKAPPTETPAQKAARKLQIKVDGQTEEIDVNSLDDVTLAKQLQMAKAASKRMQEAAAARKQLEEFQQSLEKDPLAALKQKNIDVRKMVEEQILREYEESQMDEPARRAAQLQRELEAQKAQFEELRQRQEAAERAQLEEQVFNETREQFLKALDEADIPKNQETLYMMADIARVNLENGIDLTPAQMASEVRERMTQMHQHIVKELKGERLAKYLGDDVIREVLNFAVEKVKAQQNQQGFNPPPPPAENLSEDDRPQRKRQDLQDWRKYIKGR